jgi:hypothetical protein
MSSATAERRRCAEIVARRYLWREPHKGVDRLTEEILGWLAPPPHLAQLVEAERAISERTAEL